ncbi:ATP-binding protein [Rhodococcus sp. (in: high G+C Gram-positive bacteria)]|uniref:ATP-binding protein n=1 Tax=Rhodococcus sp. TaxID=1831 RepID=UPI00257B1FA7|nr:ATP-binding protein [Rhodococcus sp. (in: high G+C Gram-positive bacteria)]MBQ7804692.1 ATP-binding protein [Rhodococcus sp. (in: high G+C Gram-positive bacteria)]
MLGRQQIAGIPTAISELFKNAHDAYATDAVVHFLRNEDIFILRDNGIGMTKDQFLSRWLTLGTSSKARHSSQESPPSKMQARAILGEKGIGRLAIAAIGSQTLTITKKSEQSSGDGTLTAAMIHWGAFELYDADLSQILIPTQTYLPSEKPDLTRMASEIADNIRDLSGPDEEHLSARIIQDLDCWRDIDYEKLINIVGQPDMIGDSGTCFIIVPTSPDLTADLLEKDKEAAPLLKTLIGFANTMTPKHSTPNLKTAFFDHKGHDNVSDLIEDSEFFTPEEFIAADHHFQGRFDEYGQFNGSVSVFGGAPIDYSIAWLGARGTETKCGPFHINLAYVQGRGSDSRLEPNDFNQISNKLERFGGLYIYRDGIRVLPYGDARVDWLDIELRRSKSASDHFFSHRRMFGAVEISREKNYGLREKAGREGFATNEAYRQFRGILEQFFVQVAAEFFKEGGIRTESYDTGRIANTRLERARKARKLHVSKKRKSLQLDLDRFFVNSEKDTTKIIADEIRRNLKHEVSIALNQSSPATSAELFMQAEEKAKNALTRLSDEVTVKRPRGIALSDSLARDMQAYERHRSEIMEKIIQPLAKEVEEVLDSAEDANSQFIQRRVRFDATISRLINDGLQRFESAKRDLQIESDNAMNRTKEISKLASIRIRDAVQDVRIRSAKLDVNSISDREFLVHRSAIEERLQVVTDDTVATLQSIIDQWRTIIWPVNGDDGITIIAADQVEELETRLESYLARAEQDLELTQLGLAVEIINHEFQASIRNIRSNIKRLRLWANSNPELRGLYLDLRNSFEHLDGYLKLFTPLHRRLYRSPVEIRGRDIERFTRDVFKERLDKADIIFFVTEKFQNSNIVMYPSTLYPVFVNLIDNAIHWLTNYPGERQITLDFRDGDFIIEDSGQGISNRDRDSIFELGFSRKISGTGYGLYISRQILRREGMSLELEPPSPKSGAQFRIVTNPTEQESR